jgi:hypothetical protein
MGFKDWNMAVVKPNFKGRFVDTHGMFIDADEYERKKQKAITDMTEQNEKDDKKKIAEEFKEAKELILVRAKQNLEKRKEVLQQKIAEFKMKQKEKHENAIKEKDYKIEELEERLKSGNVKSKVQEIVKEFSILLYDYYTKLQMYNKKYTNSDLTKPLFIRMVKDSKISYSETKLKEFYDYGKSIVEVY